MGEARASQEGVGMEFPGGFRARNWNRRMGKREPGWVEVGVKSGCRENQSDLRSQREGTVARVEGCLSLDRACQESSVVFWGPLWQPGYGPYAFAPVAR